MLPSGSYAGFFRGFFVADFAFSAIFGEELDPSATAASVTAPAGAARLTPRLRGLALFDACSAEETSSTATFSNVGLCILLLDIIFAEGMTVLSFECSVRSSTAAGLNTRPCTARLMSSATTDTLAIFSSNTIAFANCSYGALNSSRADPHSLDPPPTCLGLLFARPAEREWGIESHACRRHLSRQPASCIGSSQSSVPLSLLPLAKRLVATPPRVPGCRGLTNRLHEITAVSAKCSGHKEHMDAYFSTRFISSIAACVQRRGSLAEALV